jgi:diguanylate cyclase (GGDEF)-like protein
MKGRGDSFTQLRDYTRWRFALLMCGFGMLMMIALGVLNARSGRTDSVWLSVVVFFVLAGSLTMLLMLPRELGGKIYFWMTAAILVFLPWFGYHEGRTFHYWTYVLPPVLFFVMRTTPALLFMIVFGIYSCIMAAPITPAIDVARIGMSYMLLVGFMYTYAQLEERAAAMLRYHSDHDALTNCLNRRTFNEQLQKIEAAGKPCTVLLIDIDHFKSINDQHGHLVGDRVITQVAAVLGRVLDADALLFRYGGEEFAVILPGTDERTGEALAERLRAAVEKGDVGDVVVTISLGVAAWKPCDSTMAQTLDAADHALYAAKRGGRNRVVAAGDMKAEKMPA